MCANPKCTCTFIFIKILVTYVYISEPKYTRVLQCSPTSVELEVRQARLDRQSVHGEESFMSSVAFSRSISVELDSEGSIVST